MVHKTLFKAEKTTSEKKKKAQIPKNDFYQIKKAKNDQKIAYFSPILQKRVKKSSMKYSEGQEADTKNVTDSRNGRNQPKSTQYMPRNMETKK